MADVDRLPAYHVQCYMTFGGTEHCMGKVRIDPPGDLERARRVASEWVTNRTALQDATALRAEIIETRVLEVVGPEVIDLGLEGAAVARALNQIGEEA